MLYRGLGACIGCIERRVGAQQRGYQCADPAIVVDMLPCFFQEEEGRLGIDGGHLVIFGFRNFDDRLLQNLAHRVDGNVGTSDGGNRIGEQFLHRTGGGEIGLEGNRLRACGLHGGDSGVRVRFGRCAVIMNCDRLCPVFRKIARDQSAEVLGATGDDNRFALDAVVRHGFNLLFRCGCAMQPLSNPKSIV